VDRVQELLINLKEAVKEDKIWTNKIDNYIKSSKNIHIAIFVEPFLQWIIDGKKIIESRFSVNKCAPFKKVAFGDLLILKKSGGPVVAIATAGTTWFYELEASSWADIKDNYAEGICALDPAFWESRKNAEYATLIKLDNVLKIKEFNFPKKDRRGWVILKQTTDLKLDI
jgi:hypothetical protein